MALKVALVIVGAIGVFLIYVSTRDGKFHYERNGLIAAAPDAIFPYIRDLRKGDLWSPYSKIDPNMRSTFSGPEGEVGAVMEFEGNQQAGSGKIEILRIVPNELVELKLTMKKPFRAENIVQYRLTPEAGGTRFSWSMQGDGGFIGKLMNTLIDCEEMVAGSFSEGIQNLKTLVEGQAE